MDISIIIPVYNEVESIGPLYQELKTVIDSRDWRVEVLFVDDGSTDGSADEIRAVCDEDERIRLIEFSRNFGQTAAMLAAIDHAEGEILVPMDADLQNDPSDIPMLVDKLAEGYEVVSGWRKNRKDKWFSRRLPSIIANKLISRWSRVHLHDYGCTLKAYRATVLRGAQIYGEMHRFIPIYASWRGGKVTEVVVNHRARQFGSSKYGIGRTFKVLLDLLTIKFLGDYATKPAYLFGGTGLVLLFLGVGASAATLVEKLVWDEWPHKMTVMLLGTFLVTIGILFLSLGLLAELLVRVYHAQGRRKIYVLKSDLYPRKPAKQETTEEPRRRASDT